MHAYLKSTTDGQYKAYEKPVRKLNMNPDKLQVLKPFYALADAGDYWVETFHSYLRNDLKMISKTWMYILSRPT